MSFNIDGQTLGLISIAFMNMVTMILGLVTAYYSRRTEQNTNSMKDALVASTAKVSHAEGVIEGREIEEKSAERRDEKTAAVAALGPAASIPVTIVDPKPLPVEIVDKVKD